MSNQAECEMCGSKVSRADLFRYGYPALKRAGMFYFGVVACRTCQEAWIKRHTVTCCDCGSTYITVNVGAAKRCKRCATTYNDKVNAVSGERKRTKDRGLPSGMTREAWAATLGHFGGGCAYCGGSYSVIEHFTPVKKGGGTDIGNCIPACSTCNKRKRTLDGRSQKPELANALGIPVSRLVEIENYLTRIMI